MKIKVIKNKGTGVDRNTGTFLVAVMACLAQPCTPSTAWHVGGGEGGVLDVFDCNLRSMFLNTGQATSACPATCGNQSAWSVQTVLSFLNSSPNP